MSQGRSPSGVASLRARFESNSSDKTPPPSRGRSPAESVTSETSRPLSKVRTSFVAVEPSGHMASTLEVPKTGPTTVDGSQDAKVEATKDSINTPPTANGLPLTTETSVQQRPTGIPPAGDSKTGKGDAAEGDIPSQSEGEGLGSILKGSPFEAETGKQETAQQDRTEPSNAALQTLEQSPIPTNSAPTAPTEKSNEIEPAAESSRTNDQPTQPAQDPAVSSGSNTKATQNGKPKETVDPKTTLKKAPRAIRTQDQAHGTGTTAKSSSKDDAASKKPNKSPITPRTPTSSTSTAPKASSQPAKSPRSTAAAPTRVSQGPPTQGKGPAKSAVDRVSSKATETAKAATRIPTSKPANSQSTPTKSQPASTKPRPKSPTRPAKLPAAATAPTASSAAKHDESHAFAQARSTSRQSNISTATKGGVGSHFKPTRPLRASLPAQSQPADKSKAKPRTSMASTGPSSGSFLERMMRPTQSSAQKTHDKVEPKSPPRKTPAPKPKSKSGESDASKLDDKELEQDPEQHLEPKDPEHDDQAPESTDAAPVPPTDPTLAKTDEVAKEVESAAPTTSTTKPEGPQAMEVAQ